MITHVATHILSLPAWVALLVVFALPALESSAFVGFIFPGEIALVLGGVLAYEGRVSLVAVLTAAIAGSVVGDSVGYAVGKRYGRRLVNGTVGRFVKNSHLTRAEIYLAERGGKAVFFGRFTAALRVLIPGLAGMSGMRYRTFLTYNVASAVGWGTLSVMLGYLGGTSWRHAEHIASRVGLAALILVVAWILGSILLRRTPHGAVPCIHETFLRAPRTLVVIPTYNEVGSVGAVLDGVRSAVPDADILVVDDNSPDGTAALVTEHPAYVTAAGAEDGIDRRRRRVFLLSRPDKNGLGAAYRAGFAWAMHRGYDAVVQMDADLSHPASRIPALLEALETADVAIGSRYVRGGRVQDWPARRRLLSWCGNLYVRCVLGLPVRDTTAGFKAFRREALERIGAVRSASDGYCFQIENTWCAVRLGLTVREIPITFVDRTAGTSKMSAAILLEALTRVARWRWHELRHRAAPTLRTCMWWSSTTNQEWSS